MLLNGYTILSSDEQVIGTVAEIIKNPGQMLLNVATPAGKTILIPLHEDLIVRVDPEKRRIIMELPDGLIDLN
jgi:16S rRNA processing protein RimM